MNKPQIILPADIYDALEMSVMEYRIGRIRAHTEDGYPVCISGHMQFITLFNPRTTLNSILETQHIFNIVREAFARAGYSSFVTANDNAIEAITLRTRNEKTDWATYCKELNIVRGD